MTTKDDGVRRSTPEDGYFSLDANWGFTRVNDRAGEVLGRGPDELVGESVWDEFPEEVGESFYENYHAAMVEREPVSFEEVYEPFGSLFRVNAYPSGDGISVYLRAVKTDDDFLEARATDTSGVGVCTLDEDGAIRSVDDAFVSTTGYAEEEVIGERLGILYGEGTDPKEVERVRGAVRDGGTAESKLMLYGRDGVRYWSHVYVTPMRDGNGGVTGYLCSQRDISEIKGAEERLRERNRYLASVRDAEEELISASTFEGVRKVLIEYTTRFFTDASFYVWEEGALRNGGDRVTNEDGSRVWGAFAEGKRAVAEEGNEVRVNAPVGNKGVLSLRTEDYPEAKEDYVSSLVSAAETALDRIERGKELRELTRELEDRNEELRRLSEIDAVVRRLVRRILKLDSREEIERAVCEQLLEVEGWDYVRIAERDRDGYVTRRDSGDPGFAEVLDSVADDESPYAASEDPEPRFVRDVSVEPSSDWRTAVMNRGYLSVASVPVVHRVRDFGTVEVYSRDPGSFESRYSEALVDAVAVLGYSLASAERKDTIMSGGYNRLRLSVDASDADEFPARLAHRARTEVRIEAVAPRSEGAVLYLKTDADADEVEALAEERGVPLDRDGDGYEVTVPHTGLVGHTAESGGRVVGYTGYEDAVTVEVDLPRTADAQGFVDGLSEVGYHADTLAKTTHSTSPDGTRSDHDLTERQAEVLRAAYLNGFFDQPKGADGNELADSLGIARSTLHQHLRSAERKLVERAIDENPVR
jgi:PAS domain S-box-containing protein